MSYLRQIFNISTSEIMFFSFSSVLGDLRVQFKTLGSEMSTKKNYWKIKYVLVLIVDSQSMLAVISTTTIQSEATIFNK